MQKFMKTKFIFIYACLEHISHAGAHTLTDNIF